MTSILFCSRSPRRIHQPQSVRHISEPWESSRFWSDMPDVPRKYLGYAETAFFGGRTSAHMRKVVVPVSYVDFVSMYPTVNSLMGLWRFVIAREIVVVDHCQAEVEASLRRLTADDLFNPA